MTEDAVSVHRHAVQRDGDSGAAARIRLSPHRNYTFTSVTNVTDLTLASRKRSQLCEIGATVLQELTRPPVRQALMQARIQSPSWPDFGWPGIGAVSANEGDRSRDYELAVRQIGFSFGAGWLGFLIAAFVRECLLILATRMFYPTGWRT